MMKLFLIAVLATTALSHYTGHNHTHEHDEHCGTHVEDFEILESTRIAEEFYKKVCSVKSLGDTLRMCQPFSVRRLNPVVVPVWYHVVHNGNQGRLTEAQIQRQFDQTQKDFAGEEDPSIPGAAKMDITFDLAGITYTDNALWFSDLDRYESQVKAAVAVDNRFNFNQYMGGLRAGLLGFCYFPNSFPESSNMHGCVNLWNSVPGSGGNYGDGKTTTHETGHGIGLFHTFQGGCNGNGDQVSDTCNQASPTSGCPSSRDSCNDGCPDPINNYMDYSFDRCMTQFTPGQNTRANQQLATFRPSLYLDESEIAAINAAVPNAWKEAQLFQVESQARYMARKIEKYSQ